MGRGKARRSLGVGSLRRRRAARAGVHHEGGAVVGLAVGGDVVTVSATLARAARGIGEGALDHPNVGVPAGARADASEYGRRVGDDWAADGSISPGSRGAAPTRWRFSGGVGAKGGVA
jgi:hypothetical protein